MDLSSVGNQHGNIKDKEIGRFKVFAFRLSLDRTKLIQAVSVIGDRRHTVNYMI